MDEKYEPAVEIKQFDIVGKSPLKNLGKSPNDFSGLEDLVPVRNGRHPTWAYKRAESGEGYVIYSEASNSDNSKRHGAQINVLDSHGEQLVLPTEKLATQVCHAINSAYNSGLLRRDHV
jgi:hypothetical protein